MTGIAAGNQFIKVGDQLLLTDTTQFCQFGSAVIAVIEGKQRTGCTLGRQ